MSHSHQTGLAQAEIAKVGHKTTNVTTLARKGMPRLSRKLRI